MGQTWYGGHFLFDCNFDIQDLNLDQHAASFYIEVLTAWQELHSKTPSTAYEYGKAVFYSSWHRKVYMFN